MKKSLLALAVLGAFAGAASAQTSVTVYGKIDLNVGKTNGSTGTMSNGDNSRLGFKGTEDLGGGLSANFVLEQRFDADTGQNEGGGKRPLFQGASWVGLSSTTLGAIRLGRALTPHQAYSAAFDPWGADRGRGAFDPDLMDAGYASDPLNGGNTANNRWSNAVFYTSPTFAGFKVDAAVASRENITGTGPGTGVNANNIVAYSNAVQKTPYSVAAGYNNGPIGAMATYERNALNSKIWNVGGSYDFGVAKLMATYAHNKIDNGVALSSTTTNVVNQTLPLATLSGAGASANTLGTSAKAWTIGLVAPVGPGRLLAGYGQSKGDDVDFKLKKGAVGYEYPLSKRTFVYTDFINYKKKYSGLANDTTSNTFDIGVDHSF